MLRYVREGNAGLPPARKGPCPENITPKTMDLVVTAFETFVQISQANGDAVGTDQTPLIRRLNATIGLMMSSTQSSFYYCVLDRTTVNLNAQVLHQVED